MNIIDATGVQILVPSNLWPFKRLIAYLDYFNIKRKAAFSCFFESVRHPVNEHQI